METKFYRCKHCGNVIQKNVDSGVKVVCCGEPMEELRPQTEDAGMEKHVPEVSWQGEHMLRVKVGSVLHPMSPEHKIAFVAIEGKEGMQISWLTGGEPIADFAVGNDKPVVVYEYCNVHGLWKKKL